MVSLRVAAAFLFASAMGLGADAQTLRLFNDSEGALTFSLVSGAEMENRRLAPQSWCDILLKECDDERLLIVRAAGKAPDELFSNRSKIQETRIIHAKSAPSRLIVAFVYQPSDQPAVLELFCIGTGDLLPLTDGEEARSHLVAVRKLFHAASRRPKNSDPEPQRF